VFSKILLFEFEITANICVYYASTMSPFARCLGNESGSNVVSLSDHVFHGLMLTTREHVKLAIRMLTEKAVGTGGFPNSVGNLLIVQSSCPELHDITLLLKCRFRVCPEGVAGFCVGSAQHVHPPPVVP